MMGLPDQRAEPAFKSSCHLEPCFGFDLKALQYWRQFCGYATTLVISDRSTGPVNQGKVVFETKFQAFG